MTSAAYNLHECLRYLRPGAQFGTTDNDHALTDWNDPRPMPTDAECAAAWPAVQAQLAAEAQAAQTAAANQKTIEDQLDAAFAVNDQIIADGNAWLTTGPGAGTASLNLAQLSAAMRQTVQAQVKAAQQRNKMGRLLRRKFDATT